jgi:Polyketide cyclase / dehydrase and lipid transport
VHIAAPPTAVYALIGDVTRMGEWSPECERCEWLDDATGPAVGARFRGHNKLGVIGWQTTCVVTAAEVGREFAFSVVHDNGRDETRWRYLLIPAGSGTEVVETYQFVWCPIVNRVSEVLIPRDRQLRRGIRQTLDRIKSAAETEQPTSGHD